MSDWGVWAIGMMAVGLVVSGWLWRRAEGRAAHLVLERERLDTRRRELEASLDRSEKARKRQAEELSTFRRKADKTRKRESRPAALPLGTAARVQDLETALARSERDRLKAESECERLAQDRVRLEGLVAKQSTTPPPPVEGVPADELESRLEATRAVDHERIVELEAALASRERDGARMKKRIANQEQLYAALRAELALKKDRLRAQEEQIERLQALQVALVD